MGWQMADTVSFSTAKDLSEALFAQKNTLKMQIVSACFINGK